MPFCLAARFCAEIIEAGLLTCHVSRYSGYSKAAVLCLNMAASHSPHIIIRGIILMMRLKNMIACNASLINLMFPHGGIDMYLGLQL
jgi:hypothetical protein